MKAVIVLNVEDALYENLHSADVILMDKMGINVVYPTVDVKPMPKEKTQDGKYYGWNMMVQGWNACIDEITGEDE